MPRTERSKFESFVRGHGVKRLAGELDLDDSAIYHWIRGANGPLPKHALIIQRLARESGVTLTFEDVYGHVSELRASDPAVSGTIERKKAKAVARDAKNSAREAAVEFLVKSLGSRLPRPSIASS
jgi:transposase-like protein